MRCLLLTGLMLACAAAGATPFSYSRSTVAEGVYVFTEPAGHAIVSGNTVVIVGDESVAVVDTGHHPGLTRRMIAEIRALTPKPVAFVINTHWHNDHVAGNAEYAAAFPGAKFVAHSFTARLLDTETRAFQSETCQGFLRVQSKPLREALAAGLGLDGVPLTEARRKRYQRYVDEADTASAECLEFRYRGADLAFEDRVTLRLGGREVQVMYLGRANTAGDAVVVVPDANVVAVGDILVHPFPFALQSYIGEWAAVLRRIEAMKPEVLVPGHGPPMRDLGYLSDIAGLMESIDRQVRTAYRPGMSLEDLRKQVDVAEFRRRIAGDDVFLQVNFDAMIAGSAVARAWQEASGKLEPEGLPRL